MSSKGKVSLKDKRNESLASSNNTAQSRAPETQHPNTQATNYTDVSYPKLSFRNKTKTKVKKAKTKSTVPARTKKSKSVKIKLPERRIHSSSSETESLINGNFALNRRNLQVSKVFSSYSNPKSSRFIPEALSGFTDTHMNFKTSINRAAKSSNHWQNRVHVFDEPEVPKLERRQLRHESDDFRKDIDAVNEAKKLKSKLLAGNHVSLHEIQTVKFKMLPEENRGTGKTVRKIRRIQKDVETIRRRKLYCVKGIVHIPTPHKPYVPYNTFGSPADLRISLSNQDTPEYRGRRRLFFDFSEFADHEIQLSLEITRRLVIEAKKEPPPGQKFSITPYTLKPNLTRTEIIELPRDLAVDNLRIVRDPFGNLIIEEAWKFD